MTGSPASAPQSVLTALYDGHATAMYRWAVGMLGRREDAEDAVHAVWLELARKPARLDTIEDLPAYAWTAIRRHVHGVLRRRVLQRLWTPPLEGDEALIVPAVDGDDLPADELLDLARAVRQLRPKLRAVVLLVGFAGYTLEAAARRLGVPRGTAASRHHAAIQKLKAILRAGR
ncbi:MAG: sigma-70 family RNA polymerase sigma factor [Holophagales bacterium]|nr:sigma-70 family RNA polymerase sigma factor [Holophagales bacterium]